MAESSVSTRLRAPEWQFFRDSGKFGQSNYRKSICLGCNTAVRSKRETMWAHIKSCEKVDTSSKALYLGSSLAFTAKSHSKKTNRNTSTCAVSISNYFARNIRSDQLKRVAEQAVRFALSSNTSSEALGDPEFQSLLHLINPTATLSTVWTLRNTVLNRLIMKEMERINNLYNGEAHVSISFDGWKTPSSSKWLGFCNLVRNMENGDIKLELLRFQDVTLAGETEEVVEAELRKEINNVKEKASAGQSTLIGVVSDSAPASRSAKKRLADEFPEILFLACYVHQLNLFAGSILTQLSVKSVVESAKAIVSFFNTFPKQKATLNGIMMMEYVRKYEFVVQGDTRWYSHYGLVTRLFQVKKSLSIFKEKEGEIDALLSKEKARRAIRAIGDVMFWKKMRLLSELLRPINIEIWIIEAGEPVFPMSCSRLDAYGRTSKVATIAGMSDFATCQASYKTPLSA